MKLFFPRQSGWFSFSFTFTLFLVTAFCAPAQTKIWDKTLGGNLNDELSVIVATPDGGYLLGGSSHSGKSNDKSQPNRGVEANWLYDYWVVKIDSAGHKTWDKTLGGDLNDILKTIIPTPDGGYLLAGSSDSRISGEKSEANRGAPDANGFLAFDFWLVKIDANGAKVWDKTLGGGGYDQLTAVIATADGNFLVGGFSSSGQGYDKSEPGRGSNDYWLLKVDSQGKKLWDKTLGGNELDNLNALLATPDGGYLLGGVSLSGSNGDKTEVSRDGNDFNNRGDYWVVKINKNGQKIWDKTLGGTRRDELRSLLLTADGHYLLGGYSNSNKSRDKSLTTYGYWVIKLQADGAKVWDKTYGTSRNEFQAMVPAPDGGYLLGGGGYYVVKINADGTQIWETAFPHGVLTALAATPAKEFLLGGYSAAGIGGAKTEANRGYNDYWVIKVADSNKKTQTITLASPLLTKTIGAAPFTPVARASSGLPVSFRLVSGPATLANNQLTLTGTGTVVLKARQAGNATYLPAAEVTQTIIVDPLNPVTKTWDKTYGRSLDDRLTALIKSPEGGYLVVGTSRARRTTEPSLYLIKITNQGQKEWDKDLGGNSDDRLFKGLVATDGGYLFAGTTGLQSIDTDVYKFWLVKTTSKGTKLWEKKFWGPGILADVVATPDGGYLLGGTSNEHQKDDKTEPGRGGEDYWVVKVDAAGNKQWDKTLGGTNSERLTSLAVNSAGEYLLGGYSGSGVGGDKTEAFRGGIGYGDYWLVKLNASGKKVWDKTLGGNQDDILADVMPTPDGGYLLGGTSYSGSSGDKTQPAKPGCTNEFDCTDYWVVKLNAAGQKQWDKTFGGAGQEDLSTLLLTSSSDYLLAGSSASGINGDKTQQNRGGLDFWLLKISNTGTAIWDKTLGGDKYDSFSDVIPAPDGGYLLGGTSFSGISGDKSEPNQDTSPSIIGDYWLVKLEESSPDKTQWNMRYGGSGPDNLTAVIKTSDGGYLAGGYSASGNSGDKTQTSQGQNDYWIVKSDKNGQKLWDKRYGGSGDDYLNRVLQTQDGGYLLAGSSYSNKSGDKTEASKGDRDYWVVKVDKQGNKQWDRTLGGSGSDELKKGVQLPSGDYVLGGYSNSPVSGDKSQASQGNTDYWLVKINSAGTKIWDKRYGGSGEEKLGSFTETREGGFFLGGTSSSGKSGNKSQASLGESDYWVVKTDKDGNLLWEKTFGGNGQDEVYSVGRSHGENLFIAGTSNSGKNGDKSQTSQGGTDYWLLKLDKNGTKLWDKTYGGSQDDELRASTFTDQGHYVLAGSSFSDISGDKTQASQGGSDYWVVEVNASGSKVQDQRYGGSGPEEVRTVFQTNEGGLLLGGRSDSGVSGDRAQPSQGGTDYWLVKLAPATALTIAVREATQITEPTEKENQQQLQAYPNPFQEQVTASFTLPETQVATVKVYDSQGREITTLFRGEAQAYQTYRVQWPATHKATGLYLLQLRTSTHRQQLKLLLTR